MRLIGSVLSLGVIIWVMVQAAGGGESALTQSSQSSHSLIPTAQQDALEKAKTVEISVQNSFQDQLSVLEATH